MLNSALRRNVNVAQIVQNVREQIAQRASSIHPVTRTKKGDPEIPLAAQLTAGLRAVDAEVRTLTSQIENGENRPASQSLRGRFGSFLKDRLYRLLWWHSHQIRALATLVARQNQEGLAVVESMYGLLQESEARFRASREVVAELQQHVARIEYSKANRSESTVFESHYDSKLQVKAEQADLLDLAAQIKALRADSPDLAAQIEALKTDKADQRDLAANSDRIKEFSDALEQLRIVAAAKAEQQHLVTIEERINQGELSRVGVEQVASLANEVTTSSRQIVALRLDLQDFHRRLGVFLEQAKRRMPEPFTPAQIQEMNSKGQDFLDSLYVAFEDRFRGSFEDVRAGLKVYVPYIREALQKTEDAPVLDVACGRGEWLDLLRAEGILAKGVDLNGAAIELCRQRSLDVAQEDAFAYLRKQRSNSFSALTSFHFIEHLDHRSWIALLDEALRVLKPGGVAIFETPNARNILTTAGDFYRDPTHTRPVFPETLEAIAELRGFFDSKIYYFDEGRSELIPLSQHPFDKLEDYVSVSRDAAWVGIKS